MAELVINTPHSKETIDLNETPFTIGRHDGNNFTYNDPGLSRRHCTIRRKADKFVIEDLDSKNGTVVNGVETDQTVLKDGDRIEVGELDIRFQQTPGDRDQADPESRSGSAESSSPERLVHWVHPFQITSPSPSSNWFGTGAIIISVSLALLIIGGALLFQPLQSNQQSENLLGPSGDVIQDLARWELNGASRETVEEENEVFQLSLSSKQSHAAVHFNSPITVEASSSYVFSARLSAQNLNGLSGIHLRWIDSENRTLHEELILPTRNQQDWIRKSSRPLRPPAGARRIKFSLFAAGNQGIAFFDELVLKKNTDPAPSNQRIQHSMDDFPLSIDRSGQLLSTESSGGPLLQSGLRFWKDGKRSDGWTTSIMNRREKTDKTVWSGTAFTPTAFHPVNVQLALSQDPPDLRYSLPDSLRKHVDKVGFQFQYRNSPSEENPIRLLKDGERIPVESGRSYSNVLGIEIALDPTPVLFQFSHPLSVRLSSIRSNLLSVDASMDVPVTRSNSGRSAENGVHIGFKIHPADSNVQPASPQPNRTPAELHDLIQSGKYGQALAIFERLQPFEKLQGDESKFRQLHSKLLGRIERSVERAREDLAAARELNRISFLNNALDRVRQLRKRLGTHQRNWKLSELLQKLQAARNDIGGSHNENSVQALYDKFTLYRDAGRVALARHLASEIVQRDPPSEMGREARSFLEQHSESNEESRDGNGNSN